MRLVSIVAGLVLLAAVAGCTQSTTPVRKSTAARWEWIFFRPIDIAVSLSGLQPLRDTKIAPADLELRVWRGFGLGKLEGVRLRRLSNEWSATHFRTNDYSEPTAVELTQLPQPRSGWDHLWSGLESAGILTLPDSDLENCAQIDGIGHVVEISFNGQYRTYHYPSDISECTGSAQMDRIAEMLAIEFDDGTQECKEGEWLPCGKVLNGRRQENTNR